MRELLILFSSAAAVAAQTQKSVPLFFVENRGQVQSNSHWMVKGSGITAYFGPRSVTYRAGGRRLSVEFAAAGNSEPEGFGEIPGRINFLIGNSATWRTNLKIYGGVIYRDLYPGIDLTYTADGSRLKSEFVVGPGADPSVILVHYDGVESLAIAENGDLVVPIGGRELREAAPRTYQGSGAQRVSVRSRYVLTGGNTVRLEIGRFDRAQPLIIDPTLSYSTLLGGSNSDSASALAVDSSGSAYITGYTSSFDFPTAGPEQNQNAGGNDIFVAKLNLSGNGLVYCTYIGGSGDDQAFGIAVDSAGAVYVAGSSTSRNFPTRSPLQSALLGAKNAFVLKLSALGNSLIFSTYFGGSGIDAANGIALDPSNNIYITGDTTSLNFPATVLQVRNHGGQDAFISSFTSDGRTLRYSTYLGGSGTDHAAAIAVDSVGSVYVTGSTFSIDFPTANAFQHSLGGGQDAFVTRLSSGGTALTFSTYLGGAGGSVGSPEGGNGIALDSQGSAYIAGVTGSSNFPLLNPMQAYLNGSSDAFVTKLSSAGSLVYSTYLGGSGTDSARAIAVDAVGKAYVVGYTISSDFPVQNGFQVNNAGDYDAFMVQLSSAGNSVGWSSYLGGSGSDSASADALDPAGNLYVAGSTLSPDFPLANPFQSINTDNNDAFVAKIGVPSVIPVLVGATPSTGGGVSQIFSIEVSDPAGATDLNIVALLLNTSTASSNGCLVTYTRASNTLALSTDSGAFPGGSITPGSGVQQNSQCTLNGATSSITLSGTTLVLNVSLTFSAAFSGSKTIYLQGANPVGSTGWVAKGSWTVPGAVVAPTVVSVSPSSGSGTSQTFAFTFADSSGANNISVVQTLVNSLLTGVAGCYVWVNVAGPGLYLLNDSATAFLGPIAPGANGTLTNSQCVVNGARSSIGVSGTTLTLNLALTFPGGFAGARSVYADASTATGLSSGWQTLGSWTVPGVIAAPTVVSVSPGSGSGTSQTFAFTFADSSGANNISVVQTLVNSVFTGVRGCYVWVDVTNSGLYLLNDSATAFLGPIVPGAKSTLTNSQCVVNGIGSSIAVSGTTLTLNLAFTFMSGFTGAKSVYAEAQIPAGANSGWQSLGMWTVPN